MVFSAHHIAAMPQLEISAARRAIDAEVLTHAGLADSFLEKIAAGNAELNAFVSVSSEEARADASRLDELKSRAPLRGAALAIKDNIDQRGVPTTAGMIEREYSKAAADAACVLRLRAAGAILLGKTNLPDGGLGATTSNRLFGRTANPCQADRSPGLQRRLGRCSRGRHVQCSSRHRYAWIGPHSGIVLRSDRIKPTYGAVSVRGIVPLAWSLDTLGVLANTVGDVADVFEAIQGFDPDCFHSRPGLATPATNIEKVNSRNVSLAVLKNFGNVECAPAVTEAFERSMARLRFQGYQVTELPLALDAKCTRHAGFLISEVNAALVHAERIGTCYHLRWPTC